MGSWEPGKSGPPVTLLSWEPGNSGPPEKYQIFLATIWGNAVVDPKGAGLEEADLELLHDYLNMELQEVVGSEATITTCFEFIVSQKGQNSLDRQKITSRHREFLNYFARLILAQNIQN